MQQKKENFEDEKIALPMNLGIRVIIFHVEQINWDL